jgi:hypothetical protein
MKHQRRDTSVLFSLKDLADSKEEAPTDDEGESTLIDISASTDAASEDTITFDPFQQFDSGEEATKTEIPVSSAPISIKAPILKRKGMNPMVQGLLIALIAGGGTAAAFIMMNKDGKEPVAQVAPASSTNPTESVQGDGKQPTTADQEPGKPAASADSGTPTDTATAAATSSDGGVQGDAEAASAVSKPAETATSKSASNESTPKPAVKPAPRRAPIRRPTATPPRPRTTPVPPKPRPAVATQPKPAPVVTPRPAPKPNSDINAMLGKIRSKPGPTPGAVDTPSIKLPEKPTVRQIKQVVGRLRPQVSACYRRHNPDGGTIRLKARISVAGKTGRVVSAEVLTAPYAMNQTGSCIIGVLRSMSFSPFAKEKHTFRVPFLVP